MDNGSKNERDFYRVAIYSTFLAFAVMGGLLGSLREVTRSFRVEFSMRSVVGAVIGAAVGWLLWKLFRTLAKRDENSHQ